MTPQHSGIVACTAEGASLCYRTICHDAAARLGPHGHPEISLHTFPLQRYMELIDGGNWRAVANLMSASAAKLAVAGADFIICPDNTIHEAFDWIVPSRPWLHIADVVAHAAARSGYRTVGVMGTRYLVEGPVYRDAFAGHHIAYVAPPPLERDRVHRIIFEHLIPGRHAPGIREELLSVIEGLADAGCDAVALGCTELPLVLDGGAPLPVLDSTRLLAHAALERALAVAAH